MVKHTQTIRRQIADELFEFVWPFCGIGALRDNRRIIVAFIRDLNLLVSQWRRSGVFIVTFENISHLSLMFLLLTLNK